MSKSYAGDKDNNRKFSDSDSANIANDAAKRAEQQIEDIKMEAQNEVKKQQKDMK